jgi:hypothetical protein
VLSLLPYPAAPTSPPLDRSSPELAVRNPDHAPARAKHLHSRKLPVYGRDTMRRLFDSGVLVSGLSAQIGLSNIPFTAHHFQIVAITIQQSGLLILDSSTTMYSTSQRIMVSASFQKLFSEIVVLEVSLVQCSYPAAVVGAYGRAIKCQTKCYLKMNL